ncbi:MAG: hypothetical protein SF069_13720 [Phycisphaerae bacterium]|nr:hypothetical protein [Phycisphaerae bacterium]
MTAVFAATMASTVQPAFAGPANCNPSCPNVFTETPVTDGCGKFHGAGATLFSDFFRAVASTNDFIDVDNDGCFGFDATPTPPCGFVDQLAPGLPPCNVTGCWNFTYRSVGSVNGVSEFINFQCTGDINTNSPGEDMLVNRTRVAQGGAPAADGCTDCEPSGSPYCVTSIDFSLADVPGSWATRNTDTTGNIWSRNPGLVGYGFNPITSNTGFNLPLPTLNCLNTNVLSPDANTVFETPVAWGPVLFITNKRTGVQNISILEGRHLFVSGRMPNGENLVGSTRSNGSGTRNAFMNTIGIDPAWGRGDNIGNESAVDNDFRLGANHRATNAEGSGQIEIAVQARGLAIGFTGAAGGSRAVADQRAGRYEICDVIFNDRGGSSPVRVSVDNVLDNCDPNTGYQIGGAVTFTTRGNPEQTNSGAPDYMASRPTAAYLNNIRESIESFSGSPNSDLTLNTPGDFLARTFFLNAGTDCQPELFPDGMGPGETNIADPIDFNATPGFNQTLQDFIRANNNFGAGGNPTAFGSVNRAGLVPQRLASVAAYSDGSTTGAYANRTGAFTIGGPSTSTVLSERNDLMGDFNNDNVRDINDIPDLIEAVNNPRAFVAAEGLVAGNAGGIADGNYVIPEIIGDYDGDGDLNKDDVRYHADGLAIEGGALDRKAGFTLVDQASALQGLGANYFNTTLATGTYDAGDSRGDVAGSTAGAAPGAQPLGFDGTINCQDIAYVQANFGVWANLDDAALIDLSADMDGDLDVDQDDVVELVEGILDTTYGDVNLDGVKNAADRSILVANQGQPGSYCNGDLNSDGIVDAADLAIFDGGPACLCADSNCDGFVTVGDIGFFVDAIVGGEPAWAARFLPGTPSCGFTCANDTNNDGFVTVGDIASFVTAVSSGNACP